MQDEYLVGGVPTRRRRVAAVLRRIRFRKQPPLWRFQILRRKRRSGVQGAQPLDGCPDLGIRELIVPWMTFAGEWVS
jgi:hypothetical protein